MTIIAPMCARCGWRSSARWPNAVLFFGNAGSLDLCRSGSWDLLCHHGAEVGDYRSPVFAVAGTLAANTRNFPKSWRRSADCAACRRNDHRSGTVYCEAAGLPLRKFVIPNPFGPFEEPSFCAYLIRQWQACQAAEVRTPAYCPRQPPCRFAGRGLSRLSCAPPERLCRDPGCLYRPLRVQSRLAQPARLPSRPGISDLSSRAARPHQYRPGAAVRLKRTRRLGHDSASICFALRRNWNG